MIDPDCKVAPALVACARTTPSVRGRMMWDPQRDSTYQALATRRFPAIVRRAVDWPQRDSLMLRLAGNRRGRALHLGTDDAGRRVGLSK